MTLFIGDSYFESFNWWQKFYEDYAGKAAFTSAIGGTRVTQWLNWIDSLIKPYDANLKNIVIHLGYNDINATMISPQHLVELHELLLEKIHSAYPNANIYTYGIGVSYWFETANNGMNYKQRVLEHDALLEDALKDLSYVKFLNVQKEYDKYVEAGNTLESFFKDGTHPTDANYKVFMDLLTEAGCVITNK